MGVESVEFINKLNMRRAMHHERRRPLDNRIDRWRWHAVLLKPSVQNAPTTETLKNIGHTTITGFAVQDGNNDIVLSVQKWRQADTACDTCLFGDPALRGWLTRSIGKDLRDKEILACLGQH